jgi:hypothetical protein
VGSIPTALTKQIKGFKRNNPRVHDGSWGPLIRC